MNLSIRAAAEENPAGAALIFADQTLSYEAVAERVKARLAEGLAGDPTRPFPLVAAPTVEALVTLLACFETQRPIGLLSPPLDVRAKITPERAARGVSPIGNGRGPTSGGVPVHLWDDG